MFVHEFAKRMHCAGTKIFVLTTLNSDADKEFDKKDDVPVVRIKMNRLLIFNPFRLLSLLRIFRKVDIVHVHAIDYFGVISTLGAKLFRKPVVVTVHRADVLPSNSFFFNMLRIIALKAANAIIAVSVATKKLALNIGAPKNKVAIIYNAVDESIFAPRSKAFCRSKLALPQNSKIILSVGNLIPRKGFKYLIEALPKILTKIPNSILIIVGDGPQREELKKLAKVYKVEDKIMFTGGIATEELCLYYCAADVFALSSLHEGHAVVLLEAMSSGLPIVATRVGGNLETIINDKNGYLVEPKNVNQLANSIIEILSSEKRIHEYGNASLRIYKEKFSEEKQIWKIVEVYSKVIQKV
ncbi:MAG: glycosyltransferase family 4 protein [Candidatus Methanomethyliaceae archaeon]